VPATRRPLIRRPPASAFIDTAGRHLLVGSTDRLHPLADPIRHHGPQVLDQLHGRSTPATKGQGRSSDRSRPTAQGSSASSIMMKRPSSCRTRASGVSGRDQATTLNAAFAALPGVDRLPRPCGLRPRRRAMRRGRRCDREETCGPEDESRHDDTSRQPVEPVGGPHRLERAEEGGRAVFMTAASAGAFAAAPTGVALQGPPTPLNRLISVMTLSILGAEVELTVDPSRTRAAHSLRGDPDRPPGGAVDRTAVAIAIEVMRTMRTRPDRHREERDDQTEKQQGLPHAGSVTADASPIPARGRGVSLGTGHVPVSDDANRSHSVRPISSASQATAWRRYACWGSTS
jgi:hypothetical protein